jgi:Ca2+-binding EF-hand superfamily protein
MSSHKHRDIILKNWKQMEHVTSSEEEMRKMLDKLFDEYDIDKDGMLSVQEVQNMMNTIYYKLKGRKINFKE